MKTWKTVHSKKINSHLKKKNKFSNKKMEMNPINISHDHFDLLKS